MIKRFENFDSESDSDGLNYITNYTQNVRDIGYDRKTPYDMKYVKLGCDRFVGPGFYEKVVKRSEYIVGVLNYLESKMDLLQGFADMKFADITKKDKDIEAQLRMGISNKTKGSRSYNGFRYIRNVKQNKIICYMIADFIYNTNSGTHTKIIRTEMKSMLVRDPKYNILNMPENKDLYPNLNQETIDYVKNYDIDKEFIPSIRLDVGVLDHSVYRSVGMSIGECDKALEAFMKVYKVVVKKESVVVVNDSNKYHETTTEYNVRLHL
jgi:hypothetical protein